MFKPAVVLEAAIAPGASLHRFDAYRLALAFRAHVVRWLPLKRAELSDQLDRASISAVLNLAELAGRAVIKPATTRSHEEAPMSALRSSTCWSWRRRWSEPAMPARFWSA